MASRGATALSEKDLLSECWSSEPSSREDGNVLYHALSLAGLLFSDKRNQEAEGDSPSKHAGSETVFQTVLNLLISLLRAERAYLFEVRSAPAQGESKVGRCLASWNLD